MAYQIVKIVNIPVFNTRFDHNRGGGRGDASAEVWQPVGKTHADLISAQKALGKYLAFNKGNGIFYMLVETHGQAKKA